MWHNFLPWWSCAHHEGSWEDTHQIWAFYLKAFSRYTHLVPSNLLFETPLRFVFYSHYKTKRTDLLSRVDYWWSNATAHGIWTKYWPNFYSSGTTFIVLSFHHSKLQITIRHNNRPPPFVFCELSGCIRHVPVVFRIVNWKGLEACRVRTPLFIWTKFVVC